jgi:glycine/D-amino acid oxidase-like deaminating enzyme
MAKTVKRRMDIASTATSAADSLVSAALRDAEHRSFWLSPPADPAPRAPLDGTVETDLVVVGGGLTGLWAALEARERDPGRDVVLVEAESVAFGASGRNGGFCDASLTHGIANGLSRWPEEMPVLEEMGRRNLDEMQGIVQRHGIDAAWERTGVLSVATEPHQVTWMAEEVEMARRFGWDSELLDRDAVQALVHSPTYRAAARHPDAAAMVDPARLAWGLAGAAEAAGVRVFEATWVAKLERADGGVVAVCPSGRVSARRAVLATSAYPGLVRQIRRYVVPVYDYVLVTEPLSGAQRESLGWRGREGIGDSANQFHYYRLTRDDRILWGGYDAIYHFRNGMGEQLEHRAQTFEMLARDFFATFPQLEGVRFTHRWAGAIDTSSRFCVTFGKALGGRAVYAVGFTGLGVGASRFGARTALDLADGLDTERTRLRMVQTKPVPFPPEPLRWAGIQLTRRALARADRRQGRRGPWLRALDRLGMGFDS